LGRHSRSLQESARTRTALTGEVARVERELDELVYKLYGLTPEEIKLVEESGQK
jgi:hypothetical protein